LSEIKKRNENLFNMSGLFELRPVGKKFGRFKRHSRATTAADIMAANAARVAGLLPAAPQTGVSAANNFENNFVAAIKTTVIFLRPQQMRNIVAEPIPIRHLPFLVPSDLAFAEAMKNFRYQFCRHLR
jgi:hypothetical protein